MGFRHLLLGILVSLPAFCAGHLVRHGEPMTALRVSLLAGAVVIVASAIAGIRRSSTG